MTQCRVAHSPLDDDGPAMMGQDPTRERMRERPSPGARAKESANAFPAGLASAAPVMLSSLPGRRRVLRPTKILHPSTGSIHSPALLIAFLHPRLRRCHTAASPLYISNGRFREFSRRCDEAVAAPEGTDAAGRCAGSGDDRACGRSSTSTSRSVSPVAR